MAPISRRQMLRQAATGFGSTALLWMLHQEQLRAEAYDLRPKKPNFAPKVKSVIYLYMGGGPSTIDMFDPKPVLKKYDGQDSPAKVVGRRLGGSQKVMASPWEFKQYGESGRWVSELMPNFAKVVDHTTFLRAVTTDRVDHSTAQFSALTGRGIAGFPSIGSGPATDSAPRTRTCRPSLRWRIPTPPSATACGDRRGFRPFIRAPK